MSFLYSAISVSISTYIVRLVKWFFPAHSQFDKSYNGQILVYAYGSGDESFEMTERRINNATVISENEFVQYVELSDYYLVTSSIEEDDIVFWKTTYLEKPCVYIHTKSLDYIFK